MSVANTPTAVALSPYYNRIGIYTDGTIFSGAGGLDGGGYAYSASQLGSTQIWDSVQFSLGPQNAGDVVRCAGQTIALPTNRFTSLLLLATGVNGNQPSQTLTVTYTDGTTSTIVQSFSDWVSATAYSNQFAVAALPYRLHQGAVNTFQRAIFTVTSFRSTTLKPFKA